MVLEKTHERPSDCKEIQQSILKEISPEYSLEGLMLKLKLQYTGHLMGRINSLEKTLILGKIEGRRQRGQHVINTEMIMTKKEGQRIIFRTWTQDGKGLPRWH